jgi:hypothetical protein
MEGDAPGFSRPGRWLAYLKHARLYKENSRAGPLFTHRWP